jgi:predicted outer membrane lipoprotein
MQIKDSGDRREFGTGAVRDMAGGKGRCDLLPACALLKLSAYRANNRRSHHNYRSAIEDAMTRLMFYLDGEIKEDYLCAAACDLLDAMWMEEKKSIDIARYSSYPACAILRLSRHYENGAKKYAERNWEKGIPISCMIDSGVRHLLKYLDGATDEDHLCAAAWNILGAMWMEEKHPNMQDIPTRTKDLKKVSILSDEDKAFLLIAIESGGINDLEILKEWINRRTDIPNMYDPQICLRK